MVVVGLAVGFAGVLIVLCIVGIAGLLRIVLLTKGVVPDVLCVGVNCVLLTLALLPWVGV